jgi:hypothetical protein
MKQVSKVIVSMIVVFSFIVSGTLVMDTAESKPIDVPALARNPVDAPAGADYPFRTTYPSLSALYTWYDSLILEYPTLISKINIGKSWENRDLWVLRLTSSEEGVTGDKPAVMIEGNIHAREWSASQATAYFMWMMLHDYNTNDTIHWLLNNRQIYVLPMVNPDGYFYDGNGVEANQLNWRKNRNNSALSPYGVDLNRNWDIDWINGVNTKTADDYHGMAPFSEYESKAIKNFMLAYGIDSFQCIHSYAGVLLIPWCYTAAASPHNAWYRNTASKMTNQTSLYGAQDSHYDFGQPGEKIGYSAPGGSIDWAYDALGAQGYCFELETGGAGFYPLAASIMTINQDVDDALVYQARIADTDIGDGTTNLFPPVPYLVYGNVYGGTSPMVGTLVTITNKATSETLTITTDSNGYYELDFGRFVTGGYTLAQTFMITASYYSVNFTITAAQWGKRIDLIGPPQPPTSLHVDQYGSTMGTLVSQDFTGTTFPPTGWSVVTTGITGTWTRQATASAGGTAGEARFMYGSTGTGTSRLRYGPINTAGRSSLDLQFRQFLDAYAAGVTLRVQTSTTGTTWTNTNWSIVGGTANVGPNLNTETISAAEGAGSSTFYFCFLVDGNSYNLDYWYIDNIVLSYMVPNTNDNTINWTHAGTNVSYYRVYRSATQAGTYTLIGTSPVGINTYVDLGRGTADGTLWWYIVRAVSSADLEESNNIAVQEPGGGAPYAISLTGKTAGTWVFVSFPHAVSGNIQTLLNDAALGDGQTTWTVAKWYNRQTPADPWKTYRTGSTVNDMPALTNTMGVWLWLTANGGDQMLTLSSSGSYSATAVSINLYTGWNLVGYPSATNRLGTATLPAQADMVSTWQAASPYITDSAPGSVTFSHGNAYWVRVTADCTWAVNP